MYGTVLIHTTHYRLTDLLALIPPSTVVAVEVLLVRTAAAIDFLLSQETSRRKRVSSFISQLDRRRLGDA